MALQESGEMYLESIYVLTRNKNDIHAIDICEYMGYSKPSVSRAMGILKREKYITVDDSDHIHLTEKGLAVAESIYERHTLITRFLMGLGVPEKIASSDACKIEHVISEESFRAMKEHAKR